MKLVLAKSVRKVQIHNLTWCAQRCIFSNIILKCQSPTILLFCTFSRCPIFYSLKSFINGHHLTSTLLAKDLKIFFFFLNTQCHYEQILILFSGNNHKKHFREKRITFLIFENFQKNFKLFRTLSK